MSLVPVYFCDHSSKTLRLEEGVTACEVVEQVLSLIDLFDYRNDFKLAYMTGASFSILKNDDVPSRILKDSFVQYPPKANDPKLVLLRIYDMNPDKEVSDQSLEQLLFDQTVLVWRRGWLLLDEEGTITISAMIYKRKQHHTKSSPSPGVSVIEQIMRPLMPELMAKTPFVFASIAKKLGELPDRVTYGMLPIPNYTRGAAIFPSLLIRNGRAKRMRLSVLINIRFDKITVMATSGLLVSQFEFESIVRFREESPDLILEISDKNLFLLFTSPNSGSIIATIMEYAGRRLQFQ